MMQVDLVAEVAGVHEPEGKTIDISWNGQWSDNAGEMRKHLLIEEGRTTTSH